VAAGWVARVAAEGGPIENLELWQELYNVLRLHDANWAWVRGHQGHAKNEFANDLAVRAATEQTTSSGVVASSLTEWLAAERKRKRYLDYDPDVAFATLEARLVSGPGAAGAERSEWYGVK